MKKHTTATILSLATICAVSMMSFNLSADSSSQAAFAQVEGLTPPPPRPRRAYSTIDNYKYSHGEVPSQSSTVKKPKRKKVKKTITEPTSTTSPIKTSTAETGTTKDDSGTSNRIMTDIKPGVTAGTSATDSTNTTSSTSAKRSTTAEVTSANVKTAEQKSADAKAQAKLKELTASELTAANLSYIPSPQMPHPPTSIGGLSWSGASRPAKP